MERFQIGVPLNLINSKTKFYVLSSISKTLRKFSMGFFPMYRGLLQLENDTSILRKMFILK